MVLQVHEWGRNFNMVSGSHEFKKPKNAKMQGKEEEGRDIGKKWCEMGEERIGISLERREIHKALLISAECQDTDESINVSVSWDTEREENEQATKSSLARNHVKTDAAEPPLVLCTT
ncbi:hypothetical protein NDU88_006365 [Pleurodeles waltl]|uniref:Uncharacterized protein n=1 Tax=Pleurodeles waltl TaxID=8319 RepID=A0AAV7PKQ1_PLEWA|nr:hypothetical protein NDU88_006365 [Pleurodeles waltl]